MQIIYRILQHAKIIFLRSIQLEIKNFGKEFERGGFLCADYILSKFE